MNPSFAILEKIKTLFYLTVNSRNDYRVEFAPFAFPLTNEDFIFLSTEKKPEGNVLKSYKEMSEFSVIANALPLDPYLWSINTMFLYDIYENILVEAALIDPDFMTDDEKTVYNNAKSILYNTVDNTRTEKYNRYCSYMPLHDEIENKIRLLQQQRPAITDENELANWQRDYDKLVLERNALLTDWQVLGSKQEIESALATFQKIYNTRTDFLKKWNEAKNIKLHEKIDDGETQFLRTTCLPNSIYQYNAPVWQKISLNESEINQLTSSFTGSTPASVIEQFGNAEAQITTISFEYCFLEIVRPWFDESIISNRYWKFREEGKMLSRGAAANEFFPGEVQSYPVKLILAKNIEFALKPGVQTNETLKNELIEGKRIFFGPLMLKSIPSNLNNVNTFRVQTLSDNQLSLMAKAATGDEKLAMGTSPAGKRKFRMLQVINKQPLSKFRRNIEAASDNKPAMVASAVNIRTVGSVNLAAFPGNDTKLPDSFFEIRGHIIDELKAPVSGAEIQVMIGDNTLLKSVLSQPDGSFSFKGMEQGNYHFRVSKTGYTTEERELQINSAVPVNFSLKKQKEIDYFQVIGVVCKNLPRLPDPIPGAAYI